jgi:hypothetical protein
MMHTLSPAMTLDVWEQGANLHPLDRALLVLGRCCPEHNYETLQDLSLGQRDRLLFELYRGSFGDALEAFTQCPACHERLEFSLSCGAFLHDGPARQLPTKTVEIDGILFSLRAPTSRDAAAATASATVEAAKNILLRRCATPAAAIDMPVDTLSERTQAAIAAQIALLDPQADVLVELTCPGCGDAWQGVFEVIDFLWAKIRTRARHLLQEIDALARAYGWREAEILDMSDARRGLYVQMAMA